METTEKKSGWDQLGSLAPRYVYVLIMIASILALYTINLPPRAITQNIQDTYDYIEKVKPGTRVVFEVENDYAYFISHLPGTVAVLRHVLSHNVKLIIFNTHSDGPLVWDYQIMPQIRDVMDQYGYQYGKDWVNLGYQTGTETAVAAFAANTWFMQKDYLGTNLQNIPIMQDIHTGKDIDLWIQGGYQPLWIIRQMVAKYQTPFININHEGFIADGPVYVKAGQMTAFVHGWAGATMYERLIGRPGLATAGSGVVSILYYSLIVLTIIGNISWFGKKYFARQSISSQGV